MTIYDYFWQYMTISILHGDNIGESRKALNTALDSLKAQGVEITYLDGAKITRPDLETALSTGSLFFSQALVIEGLLSRLRSKVKESLIKLVAGYQGDKQIFLWDGKEVTKTNITPFGKSAKVAVYKTPAVIFQLLETLRPGNYASAHSLLFSCSSTLEAGFTFVMLTRHVSNLLIARSGDASKLIPFTRGRLISQAGMWDENKLILFHTELLRIDRSVKTGTSKLDYLSQLDLLLATLLN